MSYVFVDQDWETNESPWSFPSEFTRTATDAMDGIDLRLVNTSAAGFANAAYRAGGGSIAGSARGQKYQLYTKFKLVTGAPTTNPLVVFGLDWSGDAGLGSMRIDIAASTTVLRFVDANSGASTSGATALSNTAHEIEMELRNDQDTGIWARIWLDGSLEIEHRAAAGWTPSSYRATLGSMYGKTGCTAVWGRMKFWIASDPT